MTTPMSGHAVSPMERERAIVTALLLLQVLLWLGFLVHRAPRFPGSVAGTLLGISAAFLMVLPVLAYAAVKRIPGLKRTVTTRLPLRRLLAWHVWTGILGAILALLHTGHRFESPLGLALTTVMLLTVLSGYAGRHFLGLVSLDRRERQALLDQLVAAYNGVAKELAARGPTAVAALAPSRRWALFQSRVSPTANGATPENDVLTHRAIELAEGIATLEYGIRMDDLVKRRFRIWLTVHVLASAAFFGLLGLHIWASLYFALRWLA